MRRHLRLIGTLFVFLFFSACGLVEPKPTDIQAAYFGSRPSREEAVALVKAHMSKKLFDPYSAVYECDEPRKAWANLLGKLYYGYAITCNINAKNRFGAYVGSEPNNFMINTGAVILDGWARAAYLE